MTFAAPKLKERSEVDPDDKWNVESLYPSFEAWEKEFQKSYEQKTLPHWPGLTTFRGQLQSPKILRELLDLVFSLSRNLEKLFTYAHLKHDEEITNDRFSDAFKRISSILYDFQQETSWIEPEILALSEDKIDKLLKSEELAPYRFHLERVVRLRPHTLTAEKEELLAMAGKPMQTSPKAFSALNNADIKFGTIKDGSGKDLELSHGLYQMYLRAPDRTLRKNAFERMCGRFLDLENTMGELLYGEILGHVFNARARAFPNSLEASLFPKKIPREVYLSLIKTVRENLPSLHRYIALRKKILKVSELHLYDVYVPLVNIPPPMMDYKQAEDLVIASVAPLGKEYQSILEKGLKDDRWVDRYENKNKRSGAYSSGCYDSSPYILMNYRGILRDVFTLAHEAGHSMHSYYSNEAQPYQYSRYPIFVAEVASTFNEELLMDLLLKKASRKEDKLFLINEKIEDIRATFFRQTMFAEFELKIHELVENETPLTTSLLKELYYQLNVDYFGKEANVDKEIAIEWARIPHFYYNFYVFQYATGISAALALAEKVLKNDETAKKNYLTFLKGGSSLYPIDLLKLAGVDLASPEPVQATIRKFDSLVSQFESLI